MKNTRVSLLIKVSLLGAIAAVVMMLSFPLPIAPPFYEFDFSEVIVLLAGFSLGVLPAIAVEAVKVFLNFLLNGTATMGVGELANFLIGIAYVIPATYLFHKRKNNVRIAVIVGTISMTIVASILNYFILLPLYAYVFQVDISVFIDQSIFAVQSLWMFILVAVVPFNIIKGVITSIVVLVIYPKVIPIIKKNSTM